MNRWQRFIHLHPILGALAFSPIAFVIGASKFDDFRAGAIAMVAMFPVTAAVFLYSSRKFPTIEEAEAHVEAARLQREERRARRKRKG